MIIVGTFEQSIELEQALAALESNFISRNQILVVFMDDEPSLLQLSGRSRDIRSNAFEIGIAIATGSAVIGASIGFVLPWGPIICGLIATFIGFAFGYSLYYFANKNKARLNLPKKMPEVTVIIQCTEKQSALVKDVLWKYLALTVGKESS
jgi:hypothetical protein